MSGKNEVVQCDDGCSISVVVPSYNYGRYLPDAVRSVVEQAGRWDLTVIDDGSTDNTNEVAKALANEYPGKFNYIYQENKGLAATRNGAASLTKGDYLLFLDADDWLCEGALEKISRFLVLNNRPAMLVCDYYSADETTFRLRKNKGLPSSFEKRLDAYLFKKTISLASGATIIRRDVFDRFDFPDNLASSEDLPFYAGVLVHYMDVTIFHEPVVNIRKHAGRMRRDIERMEKTAPRLNEEILKRLPLPYKKWRRRLDARHFLSMSRLSFLAGNNQAGKKYYWRALKARPLALFQFSYLKKLLSSIL